MKAWWWRCISSALLNGVIWLTPPPIHFISLVMPGVSGYSIAASRRAKGLLPSFQIGAIMGLTLASLVLIMGALIVAGLAAFLPLNARLSFILLFIAAGALGAYTALAAFSGALYAAYRGPSTEP